MAGPNLISGAGGPSLGWGIGLQAEPGNMGYSLAAEGVKMQERERARRAAAKAKEDEDMAKENKAIQARLDVRGVNQMYVEPVKELARNVYNKMYEHQSRGVADHFLNVPENAETYSNSMTNIAAAQEASKMVEYVNKLRQDSILAQDKVRATPFAKELFEEMDKSYTQSRPTDKLKELTGNNFGYLNQSVVSKLYEPVDFDWAQAFRQSNVKPIIVESGSQSPGSEYITTSDNKFVDVDASKAQLGTMVDNPSDRIGQGALAFAKGDRQKAIDYLFDIYVYKGKDYSKQGLKQKYSGGLSQDQITEAVKTTQVYNAGTDKDGQSRTVEAKSNYLLKPIGVTLQLPQGTINTDDFTLETETGVDKAVSLGEMVNYPVYKGSTSVVSQQEMDKLRDAGKLNTVEYKTFVTASATEKIPGRTGKPERSVTKSYAFPISAIETNPDFRKQNAPSAEWKKAAEEQTKQLHGSNAKTQRFVVNGKTYDIPESDVAEFKKDMGIK